MYNGFKNSLRSLRGPIEHDAGAADVTGKGAGFVDEAAKAPTLENINGDIVTTIYIDVDGNTSVSADGDVIGLATGGAAYITRIVEATMGVVYKIEMICTEDPAGGEPDINLMSDTRATRIYDNDVNGEQLINPGADWEKGTTKVFDNTADQAGAYLYLGAGKAGDAAEYTAGKFIIRIHGHESF